MATYSNSRINTFEQCPKKYDFQYIQKIETEVQNTIEAFMGDIVHRTLEKLYKDLQYMKQNSKQELIDYYEDLWTKEYTDNILIVKEYGPENYKEKGKKMIEDYYESYKPFNQGKTIGLETTDFYDLNEDYKIHIRIDRLVDAGDGVYEIHDYKTNNSLKTQEEADKDRQLAIYSMGVKEKYPDVKEVILVWHFLAFDKEIRSTRTDKQLEELKQEIINDIKNIEQEQEFNTKKSALCDYCEYKKMCPAWKHLYEKEITDDLGKKLADRYALLKEKEQLLNKKLQEIGDKIKIYAAKKNINAVYGENTCVTIWSKNTVKFPTKQDPKRPEFIKAIKALNIYEIYSDLDNWALEREFDKLTEIEKQVLTHFATKQKIERLYVKKL
ncbi:MAG: RecB family exonuclease [Candidatus Woesearchaeota archaeon]